MSRDGKSLALVLCQSGTPPLTRCGVAVRELPSDRLRVYETYVAALTYYPPTMLSPRRISISPTGKRLAIQENYATTAIWSVASQGLIFAGREDVRLGVHAAWFDDDQIVLKHYLSPCDSGDAYSCRARFQGVSVDRIGRQEVEKLAWFSEDPGTVRSDGARIYFRGPDTVYAWPSREARFGSGDVDGYLGDLVGDATVVLYDTLVTIDQGWSEDLLSSGAALTGR